MTAILGWLLGSELGRKIAIGGVIALAVAVFIWRIYAAGEARERARQAEAALQNLRKRIKTDDEITRMSPADRRKRLSEWVSD